jgi:hypothetical protein
MASPEPGSKVAKDLGIYLGQIYGYLKKGTVTNHKVGGYPEGKGVEVDPDEVRAAMSSSRRRGGKGGGKPKTSARGQGGRTGSVAEEEAKARAREVKKGFKDGQLISYHRGASPARDLGHSINVVTSHYGNRITSLNEADRYHAFATGTLREWVAKGVARLENPAGILGLVMFSWIADGKVDLAASLEEWMEAHDLPVSIPDPVVSEAEAAQAVIEEDDTSEELAGDDDD